MALSESKEVQMTVLASGHIQVREDVVILQDGVEVARRPPHRYVLDPGESLESDEHARVKAIAKVVWTPEVVAEHKRRVAAAERAHRARDSYEEPSPKARPRRSRS